MDLSIFATPAAWISLFSLIFLEIVLGVDNLVFIAITTNRLPEDKQHIGRRLGLAGALIMRVIFLCFAFLLVHLTTPLFTIDLGAYSHGVSVRDLVMLFGGAYLVYKGIVELRDMLRLTEIKAEYGSEEHKKIHSLSLAKAVGTIMVMDVVFSIDSVITAVGLADYLIIMIIAVMVAIFVMMIFIDPISNFINKHPEMKILALCFIVVIGALLVSEGFGIESGIEALDMPIEKLMVYIAMVFAFILELVQMKYNKNFSVWRRKVWQQDTASQIDRVRKEMLEHIEEDRRTHTTTPAVDEVSNAPSSSTPPTITPVFIGSNVYIMMPVEGQDVASFKELMAATVPEGQNVLKQPIEIGSGDYEVEDVAEPVQDEEAPEVVLGEDDVEELDGGQEGGAGGGSKGK